MPYSDNNDLLLEFSNEQLALLTGDSSASNIDYDRIDHAREAADTIIESLLDARYNIASLQGKALIKRISIDLTIYFLYKYEYKDIPLPAELIERRENALALLNSLQEGKISLADYNATQTPAILHRRSSGGEIFNDDVLDNFYGGTQNA